MKRIQSTIAAFVDDIYNFINEYRSHLLWFVLAHL